MEYGERGMGFAGMHGGKKIKMGESNAGEIKMDESGIPTNPIGPYILRVPIPHPNPTPAQIPDPVATPASISDPASF